MFRGGLLRTGLVLVGLLAGSVSAEPPLRPNIVLILCDDLGFSDLGCYGGEICTPNLDRLAAEGMRFTQFYNCAVCSATRAALLTGLHPRHSALRKDMVSVAQLLHQAGYGTALVGKWGLAGTPLDRGFDAFYGITGGCCNYFNPAMRDPSFEGSGYRPFYDNRRRITEFADGFYTTDAFTERAVADIRRFVSGGKPFFEYVCYTAPHFPLHARAEDIARHKGQYRMGYYELRKRRHQRQVEMGLFERPCTLSPVDRSRGQWRHDWDIPRWEDVKNLARENRRMEVYAAMVECLDRGVGRILQTLEELGIADETLVMFLSDNGGCATDTESKVPTDPHNFELPGDINSYSSVGPGWGWAQNTPFRRYKVWTYEGGICTPMIARWPGVIRPGAITHEVGHVVDILPTGVELAGATYPKEVDGTPILPCEGTSLVSVLRGKKRDEHDALCWYVYGNRAVRRGQWKLVWGHTTARWELYDLHADRTELDDLSAQHPELVEELSAAWGAWAERTGVLSGSSDAVMRSKLD